MKKNLKYVLLSSALVCLLLARGKEEEAMKAANLIGNYEELNDEKMLEVQETKMAIQQKARTINQEQEYTKKLEPSKFIKIPSIVANENVNIRKSPTIDGELAGKLVEGHTLELLEELDNGWYKVLYYENICYVNSDYASITTTYQVRGEIQKLCYFPEDIEGVASIEITVPAEVSNSGLEEQVTVPALEFFEVYEEDEENYLVQTNDYIGYVKKNFLEELTGPIAVVDISDQNFKFYLNNKVVLETPVVTGHPSTPSDEGLFEIYKFKENDYLRGPGYESYVDVMMFYNNGEGFHDASYHYCDNGEQNNHGWRAEWVFGGNTFLTNGSHGCVNMPNDSAMELYAYVEEGTLVLVKK